MISYWCKAFTISLRQVVAFAAKVIIACLRQVAFAPEVIKMRRLRRRTREGRRDGFKEWADGWAAGEGKGGL